MHDQKTQQIIDRLRAEFVDSTRDSLDEALEILDRGTAVDIDVIMRAAHSIKGQANTFGFPTVGAVAGMLETIMTRGGEAPDLGAAIAHIQAMLDILNGGQDPDTVRAAEIFAALKAKSGGDGRARTALIITPSGTAARLCAVGAERAGYASISTGDEFHGLGVAARTHPDVVIVGRQLSLMDAQEFLAAAGEIESLSRTPFILVTSDDMAKTPNLGPLRPFGVATFDATLPEALEQLLNDVAAGAAAPA